MPEVLVVCPQPRDRDAVRAARLEERYSVRFEGPDLDSVDSFDAEELVGGLSGRPADGVVATKDRSALAAALVAERTARRGPAPLAVARCQHKPTSRDLQRRAAPVETPRSTRYPGPVPFDPPYFVKPAVGRLSQGARRVDGQEELRALATGDGYAAGWARLAALAGLVVEADCYLVEELVGGLEVTVEGYASGGAITHVGITDSVKYAGTNSFERFEHPSSLPAERQAELAELAARVVAAHGFDDGFFNVELVVPDEGHPWILELNARLASQFAPLHLALRGRSTYDALFALACGEDPRWEPAPPDGVAVSYVLRTFGDAYVRSAPEAADGVEVLVRPGGRLSEQGQNDVASYRLAIVVGAGATRAEAIAEARAKARALPFDLV